MVDTNKLGLELSESLLKSRQGVYQDTSENRRKHRVGQHYGSESTGDKKNGEEEAKEFVSILKKNPSGADSERQLELMDNAELDRFARFATAASHNSGLNSIAQKWCKQWAEMARSNRTEKDSDVELPEEGESIIYEPKDSEVNNRCEVKNVGGKYNIYEKGNNGKRMIRQLDVTSERVRTFLKDYTLDKEKNAVSADKLSKREQREARLKKYQEALSKVREKLNDPNASEESKKMGKDLEAKWVEKISKLEKKLGKKAKTEEPEKKNIKEAGEQAIKNAEKKAEEIKEEKKDSFKKGDMISGITEGKLKVRGKFVGFDEYKGKKYVKISGKEKNSNYLIPVENAVNETASERRAEKENKKASSKEERIHTLKNDISNLRNKIQAIYDDPEVQDQTNVETGEIPSEYQSKIDKYEKKIDMYEKELKKLGDEEKPRVFSSYEEYMEGAL